MVDFEPTGIPTMATLSKKTGVAKNGSAMPGLKKNQKNLLSRRK